MLLKLYAKFCSLESKYNTLIKRYYYWKGLKSIVKKHVQACRLCQEHNKHVVKFSKMNFEAEPAPMRFISMDLIGEFTHPPLRGIGML